MTKRVDFINYAVLDRMGNNKLIYTNFRHLEYFNSCVKLIKEIVPEIQQKALDFEERERRSVR